MVRQSGARWLRSGEDAAIGKPVGNVEQANVHAAVGGTVGSCTEVIPAAHLTVMLVSRGRCAEEGCGLCRSCARRSRCRV